MENLAQYLDSTYLKLPEQAEISLEETEKIVFNLVDEAIAHNIFAVMIRPNFVSKVKQHLSEKNSTVKVGTVIGFHQGTASQSEKLKEAKKAIEDGADELDFVMNYEKFLTEGWEAVKEEVLECTQLCIENQKVAKWIIEIAALTDTQIAEVTKSIATLVEENFPENTSKVFVKSSTGFYVTENGKPNGATVEGIKIMLANARQLPVKAAGGVRNAEEAKVMIDLGVKRIGTSAAKSIVIGENSLSNY